MRPNKTKSFLAVLLGGLLLLACSTKPTITRIGTAYLDGQQCLFELAASGVQAQSWDAPNDGQCPVSAPVRISAAGGDLSPDLNTSCAMAYRWFTFWPQLNALANKHLGSDLATVYHVGSYSCRRMSGNSRRMSLHAQALAIDLIGFETTDGTRVSVQHDWDERGAKRAFLRALSNAACDHFSIVLTPNHDRAHRDHIHIDIGPWKLCKA